MAGNLQNHMNLACAPAQVIGNLVLQIQNLMHAPGTPLKTSERSPLFQIAVFVEMPKLAPQNVAPAITGQTFARIRDEACNSQDVRPQRKRISVHKAFSNQPQPSETI